jgi:hypothetical protein
MKVGEQGAEKWERSLELEPELEQALSHFRQSVYTLSEAAYSRPRKVETPRRVWRLAAGWALGCVLAGGVVSTGFYEHHRHQVLAQMAARQAEQHRLAAEQQQRAEQLREEDELLAKVDSDVARQVPTAMEPLAQLMAEDESQ